MSKVVKSKRSKFVSKKKPIVKKAKKKVLSTAAKGKTIQKIVKTKAKGKVSAQGAAASSALVSAPAKIEKKGLSQKLVDTIEKRKQAKESGAQHQGSNFFVKPPGRRGRRPKNLVDYQPENREEDSYAVESERENIEYDTGIRVATKRDESGFGSDRSEDFDEELNFDW